MGIAKRHFISMFKVGRRLFKQEQKRFNGILKFAYVDNTDTGETVFFVPDKMTADRVKKVINTEFNILK